MGQIKDKIKQTKDKINQTKEFTSTKEGSLFGLTVYIIILIVILLYIRFNSSNAPTNQNTATTPNPFQTPDVTSDVEQNKKEFQKILAKNYEFNYTITENGNVTTYAGKIYNNKESFTRIHNGVATAFYKLNDSYFNSSYATVENPFQYEEFMDIDNVLSLLDYASIKENTGSNLVAKIYAMDIYDILYSDNFYDSSTVISLPNDTISFTIQDNQVTEIHYDLKNFINYYTSGKISSLTIDLTYSNFGTIEDFSIGS